MNEFEIKILTSEMKDEGLIKIIPISVEEYEYRAIAIFEYNNYKYAKNIGFVEGLKHLDKKRVSSAIKYAIKNEKETIKIKEKERIAESIMLYIEVQLYRYFSANKKEFIEKEFEEAGGYDKIKSMIKKGENIGEILLRSLIISGIKQVA